MGSLQLANYLMSRQKKEMHHEKRNASQKEQLLAQPLFSELSDIDFLPAEIQRISRFRHGLDVAQDHPPMPLGILK